MEYHLRNLPLTTSSNSTKGNPKGPFLTSSNSVLVLLTICSLRLTIASRYCCVFTADIS